MNCFFGFPAIKSDRDNVARSTSIVIIDLGFGGHEADMIGFRIISIVSRAVESIIIAALKLLIVPDIVIPVILAVVMRAKRGDQAGRGCTDDNSCQMITGIFISAAVGRRRAFDTVNPTIADIR